MNVIIVNDYAHINGGASSMALYTAKLLAMSGYKVILFAAVGPIDKTLMEYDNIRIICLGEYDILNNPNRVNAIVKGIWNLKAKVSFVDLLHEYSNTNTVIHIHTLQKAITTSIIPASKKRGFKLIYHMHDYGLICPNLGLYNYNKQQVCRYEPMSFRCLLCNCDSRCYAHKVWRIFRQWVQCHIGGLPKSMDGGIFVSDFSTKILSKYIEGRKVANPIEVSDRYRIKVDENENVLYIGRIVPEKNPLMLAQAAKDLGLPVVFIGEGELKSKVQEINPKAIMTGWLTKDEMMKYLRTARYLVFPTLLYETQGLVVSELAAYGIPAIISSHCAANDYIEDGVNGLCFDSHDIDSLKRAMLMMTDDCYVAELGKNAYEMFENTLSIYVSTLGQYYDHLLRE